MRDEEIRSKADQVGKKSEWMAPTRTRNKGQTEARHNVWRATQINRGGEGSKKRREEKRDGDGDGEGRRT